MQELSNISSDLQTTLHDQEIEQSPHVYLVDASGYIFRAFHALPPLSRPDGTPVNAVYGFTTMMMRLREKREKAIILIIFDTSRTTFRTALFDQYKAHRPPPPPELVPQFALIRQATEALGFRVIEAPGFEADDLIATYCHSARQRQWPVTIISSDKDLMQLIAPGVNMLDPIRQRLIGRAEVIEKFGVPPEQVPEVLALMGDSSDNIPGVKGIGPKTAAELINEYQTIQKLLDNLPSMPQGRKRQLLEQSVDMLKLSRELVVLRQDAPMPYTFQELSSQQLDMNEFSNFLQENGFRSILTKLGQVQSSKESMVHDTSPQQPILDPIRENIAGPSQILPFAITPSAYELIQHEDDLKRWITQIYQTGIVAVDTETTALEPMRAELVGISLALHNGQACYIPVGHRLKNDQQLFANPDHNSSLPLQQIPRMRVVELLKPVLGDPAILKIGHNIKYDQIIFSHYDLVLRSIDDTMLMSYVLDGSQHGHGMDELASLHLGYRTITFAEVVGTGKSQITFDYVSLRTACDYAAEDAAVTMALYLVLKPQLHQRGLWTIYQTIDRPLIATVAMMEKAGVKIDVTELTKLSEYFAEQLKKIAMHIYQLAGTEFNIGSPKQLSEILFERLGLQAGKKNKTGLLSTASDVLEDLVDQGHPLPAAVLEWRELSKLKNTYSDTLPLQVNARTGRIHTSFTLSATSTGRLSSTDPNLQNIPIRTEDGRKIRHSFVADANKCLLSVDYSQIELRLMAHIADVSTLKQAFHDGVDIHSLTASQVFNVPLHQVDAAIRRRAKAINFGIIYGMSPFGLARQISVSAAEAKAYMTQYFTMYPGIRDYMELIRQVARKQGYVTTLFGRRCYVPWIQDKNAARRAFAERAAINAPLQGSAADIIKRAMNKVVTVIAQNPHLDIKMILQVHDELVFELPLANIDQAKQLICPVMQQAHQPAIQLSVPLTVEAGVGANWALAH